MSSAKTGLSVSADPDCLLNSCVSFDPDSWFAKDHSGQVQGIDSGCNKTITCCSCSVISTFLNDLPRYGIFSRIGTPVSFLITRVEVTCGSNNSVWLTGNFAVALALVTCKCGICTSNGSLPRPNKKPDRVCVIFWETNSQPTAKPAGMPSGDFSTLAMMPRRVPSLTCSMIG